MPSLPMRPLRLNGVLFSTSLARPAGSTPGIRSTTWRGFARSIGTFCAARFGLGLAEAGNFPASIKCVGDWFPKKERALATGLLNSGTNVGALATPLLVPWLHQNWGWPMAFFVTGSLGVAWIVAWWLFYEHPQQHARVSAGELDVELLGQVFSHRKRSGARREEADKVRASLEVDLKKRIGGPLGPEIGHGAHAATGPRRLSAGIERV